MLPDAVTIRLMFTQESSRILTCSTGSTLDEVACQFDITAPPNSSLLFIRNGKILASYLTVGFHKIEDGAHIIIAFQKRKFASAIRPRRHTAPECFAACSRKEDREYRRLTDLGFAHWEARKDFRKIMAEMHSGQEKGRDEPSRSYPTIVEPAAFISEDPLPCQFAVASLKLFQ
jgi:hypothetical protein